VAFPFNNALGQLASIQRHLFYSRRHSILSVAPWALETNLYLFGRAFFSKHSCLRCMAEWLEPCQFCGNRGWWIVSSLNAWGKLS
jgi:hypothetical protein